MATKKFESIRFGSHYDKYLVPNNFNSEEIKTKAPYVKSYKVWNKTNAPLFGGTLHILNDGRAIFKAKYATYSAVKNNYTNYFNSDGLEIIHKDNSDKEEKKYFDNNK